MTRLARRNKTKRIKLWKSRGFKYFGGSFWQAHRWTIPNLVIEIDDGESPVECQVITTIDCPEK